MASPSARRNARRYGLKDRRLKGMKPLKEVDDYPYAQRFPDLVENIFNKIWNELN